MVWNLVLRLFLWWQKFIVSVIDKQTNKKKTSILYPCYSFLLVFRTWELLLLLNMLLCDGQLYASQLSLDCRKWEV